MKDTGRKNRFTGEPVMQAEVQDVNWEKQWEDLTEKEKLDFLSFANIGLLNKDVEEWVKQRFNQFKKSLGYKI